VKFAVDNFHQIHLKVSFFKETFDLFCKSICNVISQIASDRIWVEIKVSDRVWVRKVKLALDSTTYAECDTCEKTFLPIDSISSLYCIYNFIDASRKISFFVDDTISMGIACKLMTNRCSYCYLTTHLPTNNATTKVRSIN
jgi:hypothetical protein